MDFTTIGVTSRSILATRAAFSNGSPYLPTITTQTGRLSSGETISLVTGTGLSTRPLSRDVRRDLPCTPEGSSNFLSDRDGDSWGTFKALLFVVPLGARDSSGDVLRLFALFVLGVPVYSGLFGYARFCPFDRWFATGGNVLFFALWRTGVYVVFRHVGCALNSVAIGATVGQSGCKLFGILGRFLGFFGGDISV